MQRCVYFRAVGAEDIKLRSESHSLWQLDYSREMSKPKQYCDGLLHVSLERGKAVLHSLANTTLDRAS